MEHEADKSSNISKLSMLRRSFMYSKKEHKFWDTQPVMKYKDNLVMPKGQIEAATPVSEVRQQPCDLPSGYEWTTCNMNSDHECLEVCELMKVYNEGEKLIPNSSKELLRWALCPPGFKQSWHIGVRDKTSKILVGFISGVPAKIRVGDEAIEMATINFLCLRKYLRKQGLATVLISEMARRVRLENIWQGAYTSQDLLPTPFTTCTYWLRMLNPMKVKDVKLLQVSEKLTNSRANKIYKLPDATVTRGFRVMEKRDVPGVTRLLKEYLSQFRVAVNFDDKEVEHWLLPRAGVIHSYVVESRRNVTDFCSFYNAPLMVLGGGKHKTVECAFGFYNVATETPLDQLMKDALIVSKQIGFDVFYAMDVMHNQTFLEKLKFINGGSRLHYYLYNHRLSSALKPSDVGLVL